MPSHWVPGSPRLRHLLLHTAGVCASRAKRSVLVADGNVLRCLLLAVSTGVPQVQHLRQNATRGVA